MSYGKTLVILIRGHGEIPIFEQIQKINAIIVIINSFTFYLLGGFSTCLSLTI